MEGKIEEERKKEERKKKERRKKEERKKERKKEERKKKEELSGPCNSAPHLFHVLRGCICKALIYKAICYWGYK
jgi:hypothetical protein